MHRECSICGAIPAVIKGFDAYAPQLAHYGSGFKASYFSELAELEKANFWFQKRNELIIWALNKYTPHFESFLEIGCGTGFVLTGISNNFPSAQLNGSEIFIEGLGFAAKRLPSVNLIQMDARQIPFINEFDVVGAFDVLEHIKEDELVLNQFHKALRPDGMIILSVPQHPWLWSAVDEYALHERRYTEKEILDKLIAAGFRIIRSTSFVTTLLPAMAISRTFQKHKSKKFESTTELNINPILNSIFAQLLNIEISGIKIGMSYPAGGSRLVIAKKS
jgi:SAM-dependent methyltransferase